jgi:hypothetical protein
MRRIAIQACFAVRPGMRPGFAGGRIAVFFAPKTAPMFNTLRDVFNCAAIRLP